MNCLFSLTLPQRRIPIDNPQGSTRIKKIFNTIASRYDLANHLLSLWTDRRWRRQAVQFAAPRPGQVLLDMCCGTGDMVFTFLKAQPHLKTPAGCDFSDEMVKLAEKKQVCIGRSLTGAAAIRWLRRDCLKTELEDETFDIISCAFGVRNMADLKKGLAEMHRLLKPGGKVCILEFSLPRNTVIRLAYLFYFRYILPIFAALITGKFTEYKYLVSSVMRWHKEIKLCDELAGAGFGEVAEFKHSFGLATTYLACKRR
jgi:demethylmenaquinone methyltransferase/2-methoxy-6-polyprenyl-1,4-benzoquinol methylase